VPKFDGTRSDFHGLKGPFSDFEGFRSVNYCSRIANSFNLGTFRLTASCVGARYFREVRTILEIII
jgi:hypothetical protein